MTDEDDLRKLDKEVQKTFKEVQAYIDDNTPPPNIEVEYEWTDEEWEEYREQRQQKLDYEEKIHNRRMAVMSGILLIIFGVALVSLFR